MNAPETINKDHLVAIISGLLASGHFTVSADNSPSGLPMVASQDHGKNWQEYHYTRHEPLVVEQALVLLDRLDKAIAAEFEAMEEPAA